MFYRLILLIIPAILLTLSPPASLADRYNPSTLVYPTFKHDLGMHHVTNTHLRIFTGGKYKFVAPKGVAAVKMTEHDNPDKKGDDDELTVFGVNSGEHVIIFNRSMYALNTYGGKGSGESRLLFPRGIAADPAGNVYVADTGNNRVVHLLYREGNLRQYRILGGPDGKRVDFDSPRGVALASNGDLYVTDYGNNRIVVLTRGGRVKRIIDKPGLLQGPSAIAVMDKGEKWSYRPMDFLIVTDRNGHRVQKLSLEGRLIQSMPREELGLPTSRFRGIAIDYYHQIYVTDEANHQIQKLNSRLRLMTSFGRHGSGDAEFESPFGIAIWRRFGQVFLSERTGAQYYWIGADLERFRTTPQMIIDEGTLAFETTERARLTITIREWGGETIRTLVDDRVFPAGDHRLRWDRKDDDGERVATGRYKVHVTIEATYSSREYFQKEVAFPITLG